MHNVSPTLDVRKHLPGEVAGEEEMNCAFHVGVTKHTPIRNKESLFHKTIIIGCKGVLNRKRRDFSVFQNHSTIPNDLKPGDRISLAAPKILTFLEQNLSPSVHSLSKLAAISTVPALLTNSSRIVNSFCQGQGSLFPVLTDQRGEFLRQLIDAQLAQIRLLRVSFQNHLQQRVLFHLPF